MKIFMISPTDRFSWGRFLTCKSIFSLFRIILRFSTSKNVIYFENSFLNTSLKAPVRNISLSQCKYLIEGAFQTKWNVLIFTHRFVARRCVENFCVNPVCVCFAKICFLVGKEKKSELDNWQSMSNYKLLIDGIEFEIWRIQSTHKMYRNDAKSNRDRFKSSWSDDAWVEVEAEKF